MPVPITFQIYKGNSLVRTETLIQDVIKVGKLSSSHLRIDDESVSRMHAVIEINSPTEIYIIDLGSTKGTLVNGQKVNKSQLQSGDSIQLGDTKLVVTIGEAVAIRDQGRQPGAARATVMGIAPTMPAASTPAPSPSAEPSPAAAPSPSPSPAPSFAPAPTPAPEAPTVQPSPSPPPPPTFAAMSAAASFAPSRPAPASYAPPTFDASAVEVQDGSRAIEVVAMFEDSVVDVQHLTNPAAKGVTGTTRALLLAGAGSLIIAFVTFLVAYLQAAQTRAAWAAWDVAGKPHNEFAVPHDGPWLDIVISVSLIFGIYAILHGLFRRFEEQKPRDYTIGPDSGTLFNVPGDLVPASNFPLVHSTGTDYELLFGPQMHGDVTSDGKSSALGELVQTGRAHSASIGGAYAYPIASGARIKLDMGANTFLISSVAPPRRYPAPLTFDWRQHGYTIATAVAAGLFLALIYSIPPDPKSLSLDAFMNDQRFAKFLIKPPEEKEEQIPEWLKKKGPDEAGGKGKRHKGEEGKMGKKTSKNKTGLYGLKGPKDNPDPHLAKMLAEEQAQKAGVLGILKAQEGSHLASIFGRDSALGNDAENVLGGLVGTQIGEAYGVGGLGLVGSGRGGGGTGEGTIGLGNLGTIGKGGGGGSGSGYGRGAGGLGGRRAHAPEVVPGTAQVRGSLDKEIIRRVIRRHINEVRFCYEKELIRKPDLYGRVSIQFTISGTGQVIASVVQQSTIDNADVGQCIAGAVHRWEFPKPQGGGIVIVTYPFVLKAPGND